MGERIYSVPRRYDLSTLFAVSLAYALLFGALRATRLPPAAFAWVAGFITFIGLAQALLFGGKKPRLASIVAGASFVLVVVVGWILTAAMAGGPAFVPPIPELIAMTLWLMFWGIVAGYLAGVLIGGVFLVADGVRLGLKRGRRRG